MIEHAQIRFDNIMDNFKTRFTEPPTPDYTVSNIQIQYDTRLGYRTADEEDIPYYNYKSYIDGEILGWKVYYYYCQHAYEFYE